MQFILLLLFSFSSVANKTAASESLPPSQMLTAAESSVSVSSIPSSQMSLPSNTSPATVSYLTSVSSDRSLKSGVNFTSLVTTATRSSMSTALKTVNVTHFSGGSSASSAIISFGHSEGSTVSVCYQKIVLYQPGGFTATPFLEIESAISLSLVRPSTLLVFSHLSS